MEIVAKLQAVKMLDGRATLLLLVLRNEKRPAAIAHAIDLAERVVASAERFAAAIAR